MSACQAGAAAVHRTDPRLPGLLKNLASEAEDEDVRRDALSTLADKFPDEPNLELLLADARRGGSSATASLALHFWDKAEVRQLLGLPFA